MILGVFGLLVIPAVVVSSPAKETNYFSLAFLWDKRKETEKVKFLKEIFSNNSRYAIISFSYQVIDKC